MSYQFTDLTVITSLQEDVKRYIEDLSLLEGDDLEVVQSALVLLRYYMIHNQYQQWYADIEKDIEKLFAVAGDKKYAEVTYVKDNPDGSADIEFEMDDDMRKIVMNEGMNMMLIKGILGCTTEELLHLGKAAKDLLY